LDRRCVSRACQRKSRACHRRGARRRGSHRAERLLTAFRWSVRPRVELYFARMRRGQRRPSTRRALHASLHINELHRLNTRSCAMTDEKWSGIDRRSGEDRHSGVDPRPVEEQRPVGERRSNPDRRSRLLRSQPSISSAEHFGRQALEAHSTEKKLDFLVQTMSQLVSSIIEIERRIKSIQQNTGGRRP